jgi:hypothetical protein
VGDFVTALERLGIGTATAVLLVVIVWLIWQLFGKIEYLVAKLATLEGEDGPLRKMEDRVDEHDVCLAVHAQQLKSLEFNAEREEGRR